MTTKSTFYHDGYRAALRDEDCSPPNVAPYYTEYCDGYQDAMQSLEPFPKHEGANDMNNDYAYANGQLAYEADCLKQPSYHDGIARRSWHDLPAFAKYSWHKNPTRR